jgi:hypothetical protein
MGECRVAEHMLYNSKSPATLPAIDWKEYAGVVAPWPPII